MSLVGNFTQHYDHQAKVDGSGVARMTSRPGEDEVAATPIEARIEETRQLARHLTRVSTWGAEDIFGYEADGPLDPNSPKFDARRWTRSMSEIGGISRLSGVGYKGLSMHGYGSDAGKHVSGLH
jgi:hypothetical protein